MGEDVDEASKRGTHEEAAHAPRFARGSVRVLSHQTHSCRIEFIRSDAAAKTSVGMSAMNIMWEETFSIDDKARAATETAIPPINEWPSRGPGPGLSTLAIVGHLAAGEVLTHDVPPDVRAAVGAALAACTVPTMSPRYTSASSARARVSDETPSNG